MAHFLCPAWDHDIYDNRTSAYDSCTTSYIVSPENRTCELCLK